MTANRKARARRATTDQAGSSLNSRLLLLRSVPDLLDQFGVEVEGTLAPFGLSRPDFDDPERVIPYLQLEALLGACARQTGCEHFGLLASERSGLPDLGLPGRAARCAPTAGEALVKLARFYNLRRGGGILSVQQESGSAMLVFALAARDSHDTQQYQMGAMAVVCNVLRDLCGPDWQASEVRFALRAPGNVRPFHRFFQAPVHFNASESMVVFDAGWLAHSLPPVDDSFRRAVLAERQALRNQAFEDFPGLVHDLIRRQVSIGPCSIETVAGLLGIHRRTLCRRLAAHGESYASLSQSVKFEVARRLLRETDLSVQQIAEFLRFSSAANFATAFRRWAGRTPREFRAGGR